jgi:two-component system LytT family response regulator
VNGLAKIRALIADDEPLSRRVVQQLLARHDDVVVVADCADGEAVREAIGQHRPDVAFLDIQMPMASGLDVARERDPRSGPVVVFVTAYDQFALPAFEVDAVDYLTKPLVEDRFDAAMQRVRDRLRGRRTYPPQLVARVGARDVLIPVESIEYIEADDVYAAVVSRGKRYLVRTPLDALERALDANVFIRVHRSYIVRIDRVAQVRRDKPNGAELVMQSGVTLPVSRRRRGALDTILKPVTS